MLLWIHQSCRCPECWTILVEVWIITVLGWMDVDPEIREIVGSDKLSVEEFPVAFQISQQYMCSDNPRMSGWICL